MFRRSLSFPLLLDLFGAGVVLVSLVFLVADGWRNLEAVRGLGAWSGSAVAMIMVAAVAYLAAHFVRAMRLWLILGSDRATFGTILGYHVTIAFFTFATPFKLGDALRATELYRLLGDDPRGFFVVWIDRLFDVAVILVLVAVMAWNGPPDPAASLVLISLGAFLVGSIVAAVLLPGATTAFIRSLLQSSSERSLRTFRAAVRLRTVLSRVPKIEGQTFSLLVLLTLGVWGLELATLFLVAVAMPGAGESLAAQGVGLLSYTLIGREGALTPEVALYRLVCVATLLLTVLSWASSAVRRRVAVVSEGLRRRPYRPTPTLQPSRLVTGRRRR